MNMEEYGIDIEYIKHRIDEINSELMRINIELRKQPMEYDFQILTSKLFANKEVVEREDKIQISFEESFVISEEREYE